MWLKIAVLCWFKLHKRNIKTGYFLLKSLRMEWKLTLSVVSPIDSWRWVSKLTHRFAGITSMCKSMDKQSSQFCLKTLCSLWIAHSENDLARIYNSTANIFINLFKSFFKNIFFILKTFQCKVCKGQFFALLYICFVIFSLRGFSYKSSLVNYFQGLVLNINVTLLYSSEKLHSIQPKFSATLFNLLNNSV